ncbi:hypothetical protein BCR37DRAFT_388924 [Protomyces lactucae-debilis]|uniref:Uncharacterized protein n=1 Tax=Protomyces lactucae-debilis TaxID=2754530 RepID=A0A1Y2F5I4_PROLT|nr:uncharacterized protein BCR37DRAFT_388924 [Protomyces lactucae-debilis]ORY78195.1 hypothetical protein BCR37DRAFT_388924 [Protomyces lactucae-debilis]
MIAFTIVVWALLKLCSANGCRQTGFAFKTTIPQRSMKWDREDCKTNCQLRHIDMVVHLNQITLAQQVPGPGVPWSWSRCSKGGGVCRLDNRVDWPVWENENKTCVCQVIVEFARWLDTDDKCKPDPNRALLEADLSMVRGAFTDFTTTWHSFDYHGNSWHWFRDAKHVKCSDPYAMDTCHLYGTCHGQFKIDHAGATGLDSDRDMIKYLSGNSHDPSESFPTQCDNEWKWP